MARSCFAGFGRRRVVLWIIASWASSMSLLSTRAYLRLKQSLLNMWIFIYLKSSFTRMFICTQFIDQFPVGLLAQLVERCTGIAEVMGSNPVRAWNFFQVLLTTTSFSSVLSCEDLLISSFHRSANMWIFIYLKSALWLVVAEYWFKKVIQGCVDYVNHSMSIMFALIIWHVSRTNQSLRQ